MLTGRRFRVRFTPDQLAYADEVAGVCRAVWNTGLDQRRQYRQRRAWINYPQQARELAETKLDPDFAWIAEAPGSLSSADPDGPGQGVPGARHLEGQVPVEDQVVAVVPVPRRQAACGCSGCPNGGRR